MKLAWSIFGQNELLPGDTPTGAYGSVSNLISTIFSTVIIAAGAIFVILLLVGGITYLTASGNEEATGKAKRLMIDAIIGLIIVLAAWAIGMWILGRLT